MASFFVLENFCFDLIRVSEALDNPEDLTIPARQVLTRLREKPDTEKHLLDHLHDKLHEDPGRS